MWRGPGGRVSGTSRDHGAGAMAFEGPRQVSGCRLPPILTGSTATVPKTVPARSPETERFPQHFDEGGFRKTAAFGTIESRSRKCHLLVYLPSAVRWPRG